jgi:hypothetical protein
MSVGFRTSFDPGASQLRADFPSGTRPSGFPLSVTAWLYFEEAPGPTDTWIVWWYGRASLASDHMVLEATESGAGDVLLTARLKGASGQVQAQRVVTPGEWHCVSVVVTGASAPFTLNLYADDQAKQSDSGSPGQVGPASYDRFGLAAAQGSGQTEDFGRFFCEHAAIWNAALADAAQGVPSDNGKMFEEHLPPQDGGQLAVGAPPDLGYWQLVGHTRSGLRVKNNQTGRNQGELFNQSNPSGSTSKPPLQWPDSNVGLPYWSAKTPIMRYDYTQAAMSPIERGPLRPISRRNPHFFIFNGPSHMIALPEYRRGLRYYSDPNMTLYLACDARDANQLPPAYLDQPTEYTPVRDLALIAKQLADHIELQALTVGKGEGPDNRYAASIHIRGLGADGLFQNRLRGLDHDVETAYETWLANDNEIPLEGHPRDWLDEPDVKMRAPWSVWFRAEGAALLREFMDHFWRALKGECDRRNLCYPLRAHLDYEGWPRETDQLALDASDDQIGTWPVAVNDPRAATEDLLGEPGTTLSDIYDPQAGKGPAFDDAKGISAVENRDFAEWWHGYSVIMRQHAMAESALATFKDSFPYARGGNYRTFVADNPAFKLPFGQSISFNTPLGAPYPGEYSTPVTYSPTDRLNNIRGSFGFGYTLCEVVRDNKRAAIDACASSFDAKLLAPWFDNVGRYLVKHVPRNDVNNAGNIVFRYTHTFEDIWDGLTHAWQRGCDEFLIFFFQETQYPLEKFPDTFDTCARLRDWIHMTPLASRDRTARVSRVAR